MSTLLHATTTDGVRLAIHRIAPAGGTPRKHPVILLHGMGSNRMQPDCPGRSLARHVAAQGFECFVPELRGGGESDRPRRPWDLDDLLFLDLPAVTAAIGAPAYHWIGISLGGVLLLCDGIVRGTAAVRSAVTLGSCLDYSRGHSEHRGLYEQRAILRHLPSIPVGLIQRLQAPIAGTALGRGLDRFHVNPDNVERDVLRRVYRDGFHSLPMTLLLSLATTFDPDGLRSRDGSWRFLAQAARFTAPIQLWAGSVDRQCSVEAVRVTAEALGSSEREVVVAGRPTHRNDYGHMDLYLGTHAPTETWPAISGFLERHDDERRASTG